MFSRQLKSGFLIATSALLAMAAPAMAQEESEPVPPDNSAVTQYTEPFPTAGGNRDAYDHDRNRTPRQALGPHRSRALERHGLAGEEVAELVAETAPSGASYIATGGAGATFEAPATGREAPAGRDAGRTPSSDGSTSEGGASGAAGNGGPGAPGGRAAPAVDGSSGIGAAISAAVGSSGDSGALLPIVLLLTLGWAALYVITRGRQTAE